MDKLQPEILAPGGSLDQALWALQGQADAVYIGLEAFSARSHANNLNLSDLAGLCAKAHSLKAKVYGALNTIIATNEINQAIDSAWQMHLAGVSAIIVQDHGFASLLRRFGPPLPLHASTQMAVHNPSAVALLADLGYSRIVLARELNLTEIGQLCTQFPSIEFEVFVHGAMCYSVSGLCMASGLMLQRSANRGDCAQICRTWFKTEPEGNGGKAYLASMNDLQLGPAVRELAKAGVHSLKIEGRMKPPAYAYHAAKAYKLFCLSADNDRQAQDELAAAQLSFGRNASLGYLNHPATQNLINAEYPGSTGVALGRLYPAGPGRGQIQPLRPLSIGDGVQILHGDQPVRFGIHNLTHLAKDAHTVKPGKTAEFDIPKTFQCPSEGIPLSMLSRHDGKLPLQTLRETYRFNIDLTIHVTYHENQVRLSLSTIAFGTYQLSRDFELGSTEGSGFKSTVETLFRQSGARFTANTIQWSGEHQSCFIRPGELKAFRRHWYAELENHATNWIQTQAQLASQSDQWPVMISPRDRKKLSPLKSADSQIGFISNWQNKDLSNFVEYNGQVVLSLAPFLPSETSYRTQFLNFLNQHPQCQFLIGINNLAHAQWLREMDPAVRSRCQWFIDYGLHCANPSSAHFLDQLINPPYMVLPWLENSSQNSPSDFKPPYFISRTCMRKHSLPAFKAEKNPCAQCSTNWELSLSQKQGQFKVIASDCINYLIVEDLDSAL